MPLFQNFILTVIAVNAFIMGLLTAAGLSTGMQKALAVIDWICMGIFIAELFLKLVVYRFRFFRSGWNLFDLVVVLLSLFSEMAFFSAFWP